jgi:predicted RNA-binding Zn ribbon-like protein
MEEHMTLNASNFKLLGGVPCLDFVNTKNWHADEKPYDFFGSYSGLLQWSLQLALITPSQAEQLFNLAEQQTQRAQTVLEQTQQLRKTIYDLFFDIANGQELSDIELDRFNSAWRKSLASMQVRPIQKTFRWEWMGSDNTLDSMLWPVLHSAAELLISEKLNRVRNCEGCGWLFLDTTKGGRRRWCDMSICGNRAKSKRHYARVREHKS